MHLTWQVCVDVPSSRNIWTSVCLTSQTSKNGRSATSSWKMALFAGTKSPPYKSHSLTVEKPEKNTKRVHIVDLKICFDLETINVDKLKGVLASCRSLAAQSSFIQGTSICYLDFGFTKKDQKGEKISWTQIATWCSGFSSPPRPCYRHVTGFD